MLKAKLRFYALKAYILQSRLFFEEESFFVEKKNVLIRERQMGRNHFFKKRRDVWLGTTFLENLGAFINDVTF